MELTERTQKSPTIKKHTTNNFSKMQKTFLTQISVLQLNTRVLFQRIDGFHMTYSFRSLCATDRVVGGTKMGAVIGKTRE